MSLLEEVRRIWQHAFWADVRLLEAVPAHPPASPARSELAHVLGTEETWLARLQGRTANSAVWPDPSTDLGKLLEQTHAAYRSYLEGLSEADLSASVTYINSAGLEFTNRIGDILIHAALHGQYHRGKVNLLLRQAGLEPAPTDYIAFIRGAPAATRPTGDQKTSRGP